MAETKRSRREDERTLLQMHLTRGGEWRLTLLGVTLETGTLEPGDLHYCQPAGGWWAWRTNYTRVARHTRQQRNGCAYTVAEHDRRLGCYRSLVGTRQVYQFLAIG